MSEFKYDEIRQMVRQQYARVAKGEDPALDKSSECCDISAPTTCCSPPTPNSKNSSQMMGYATEDIHSVPEGADMGLGCGNPQVIAGLKTGETVLDLGSGGGFDCFLAAREVGDTGQVIGVDMTPEMITKARINAEKGNYTNVEFRLGEIENLPIADETIDVILSNCVINLSPDKARVFSEALRVLKPGGRLAISDIVAFAELPSEIRQNMALYVGCIAGVSLITEIEAILQGLGYDEILITQRGESKSFVKDWVPGEDITDYVVSATIEAIKPISSST